MTVSKCRGGFLVVDGEQQPRNINDATAGRSGTFEAAANQIVRHTFSGGVSVTSSCYTI